MHLGSSEAVMKKGKRERKRDKNRGYHVFLNSLVGILPLNHA
jgi:hypothetical protein